MGREIVVAFLLFALIFVGVGIAEKPLNDTRNEDWWVTGGVYDSDGVEIYADHTKNWTCINITAYCLDEFEANIIDFAIIDNNSVDGGYDGTEFGTPEQDYFRFNAGSIWNNWSEGDNVLCIGEYHDTTAGNYTFLTNCTIKIEGLSVPINSCEDTEWEPIPEPVVNGKGGAWINISIPKFKNPQKNSYNNGTPNINNTIGFAVYRSEKNNSRDLDKDYLKVGNATYYNETCYFYNDTNLSPRTNYYYAVAVIAKGGYTTYGKSPGVEVSTVPLIILNSPNGDEDWSGNSSHLINYTILNGESPYTVDLYYSEDDANWSFINTTTCNRPGTYTYDWPIPLIDSSTVRVRINVTDNKLVKDFDESKNTFEIDSKPPTVLNAFPVNTGAPSEALVIQFNESVNTSSVEDAFSITPNPGNLSWDWDEENKTATISHNNCSLDVQYNCTINTSVKDDSDPGNYMVSSYSWSFVVAIGYGNFTFDVDYPPSVVGVGEACQIKVGIVNALENAVGKSGTLKLTFYRSTDNKTFNQIGGMKIVGGMMPGNSTNVNSDLFSFTHAGTWYLKVNITSANPDDVINGYLQFYETPVYTVEVVPPEEITGEEEEVGLGPYALIIVMVIAVIFIAAFILLSGKKK